MTAAVHGGPDAFGTPAHDFSTNANACGPCAPLLDAIRSADPTRYPDPASTALRRRLADFHGVAPERVQVAASASEFIVRITAAVALRRRGDGPVQLPPAAYGDYRRAAEAQGLPVRVVPALGDDAGLVGVGRPALQDGPADGEPDARPPILAWACEPSSPHGAAAPGLARWLALLPPETPAVLDCAYAPLRLEGGSALPPPARDRVWQLWTPNKALGLTGVRGAYAIAPVDAPAVLLQDLQALAPSWPLGAHAEAMLAAWTSPAVQHWLATQSLPQLRTWKQRQAALCESLGWQIAPGVANFFCARPDVPALAPLLGRLRAQGIKLRDCGSFGLPGWVRLGVLPPASQDALVQAWTAVVR
ncbi:aminotransferase class I/II-fold pyridoxal phosphate-dependent enzyme [Pseudacidovorax intermedius]|uniref:histidinol-phosphate transaminase n=1 Tax=Pseudacidovorax intermedius TaxID=433924 RepID=A0A147H1E7_9BURK|nr:aminotransferase class I/II-fold pyridoxal phosphate-dependent enzyme [Pseudacidovorax intermedius]KTT23779.1 aminotransferase [Pseudacidovorax intermedius]